MGEFWEEGKVGDERGGEDERERELTGATGLNDSS